MTAQGPASALPAPWFDLASDTVRFWVWTGGAEPMGATVPRRVLVHRFQGRAEGDEALALYGAHRLEIDAAVVRRAAAGSREPVMLRENDLPRMGL